MFKPVMVNNKSIIAKSKQLDAVIGLSITVYGPRHKEGNFFVVPVLTAGTYSHT